MMVRKRAWVLALLLGGAAGYVHFLSDVRAVRLRRPLSSVPTTLGPWGSRSIVMEDDIVKNAGVEDYLFRDYTDGQGLSINAYVGFYEAQREGDTAHSPKHCLPGSGWSQVESSEIEFATPGSNGGKTRANRYVIGKEDQRQLVLYWYQGRGRDITNEYEAKVYLVIDSIFRKRSDGALVRIMVPESETLSLAAAQESAIAFAQRFLPEVEKVLPE